MSDQTIPRFKAEIIAEAIRAGSAKATSSTGTSSANPQQQRNFYERFRRGEKVKAGWVNDSDFEPEPVKLPSAVRAFGILKRVLKSLPSTAAAEWQASTISANSPASTSRSRRDNSSDETQRLRNYGDESGTVPLSDGEKLVLCLLRFKMFLLLPRRGAGKLSAGKRPQVRKEQTDAGIQRSNCRQ